MLHYATIATAHFRTPAGGTALIGIDHRPQHPDSFARYLVYATVLGVPWSATCRSLEEAQAQARTWRDMLVSLYDFALCDPFGHAGATEAQRQADEQAGSFAAHVCNPEWRMARER